jgi:hypothetical protein
MIGRHEKVKCDWCRKTSELGEWNDLTWSRCTNREMKRAYTPLTEERAFLKKSDTFYECPKCHKWSRGCQLRIVDTDNPKLLRLGGQSVFGPGVHRDEEETTEPEQKQKVENQVESENIEKVNQPEPIEPEIPDIDINEESTSPIKVSYNPIDLDSITETDIDDDLDLIATPDEPEEA